jgi:hypothetical protein
MQIKGVEGLTVQQVQDEVRQGAKFVVFSYAMSFLVITLKRSSDITFIRAGQSAFGAGLPYTLLSFFLGWWGFPWGLIYTPMAIIENLSGGKDVTREVMTAFGGGDGGGPPQQGLPPVQVQ